MAGDKLISVKDQRSPGSKAPDASAKKYEPVFLAGSEPALEKGAIVGSYEIDRLIGQGGMCKVYLARQLTLNRMVALKVVEGIAADEELLDIFKTEIKTTAKINHRNVVTAIEGGVSGRNYYLSMNYIDGGTVEDIVEKNGPMPEWRAVGIILTVAETLRYILEKVGLFHKDIKPSNIMIDSSDEVFLLDLGISQHVGDKSRHSILGSPYYMSPEQILGAQLDWRTDLYSLGATFYFMVFGKPPYSHETDINRVLELHLRGLFPLPKESRIRDKVSPECQRMIAKMMSRYPKSRHLKWDTFIADLKRLQAVRRPPAPGAEQPSTSPALQKASPSSAAGKNPQPQRSSSMQGKVPAPSAKRPNAPLDRLSGTNTLKRYHIQ